VGHSQREERGIEPEQTRSPVAQANADAGSAAGGSARRPAWVLFLGLAAAVIIVDRSTKAWVISTIEPGSAVHVIGDTLRLIYSRNDGALFGLLGSAAPVMAVVSVGVIGLILWYHARSGRSVLLSTALGLLLGGAIGNLIDRIQLGYVVDWVDMGIGTVRFWTFNVGDAAITCAILLLILIALRAEVETSATHA
jgi:signal peptidase II